MAVTKSVAVPVPAGSVPVADAAASPALAAKKPSPQPIQLLYSHLNNLIPAGSPYQIQEATGSTTTARSSPTPTTPPPTKATPCC